MVGLLGSSYRAAHEPERAELLSVIMQEAQGELSADEVRDHLRERDIRLDLDYDIAWANQFLLDHLPAVFPDARFIILVRDPYTWLESTVGHLLSRQIPPEVRGFLDWWFQPDHYPHTVEDARLSARGLYSTAAFLRAWDRHIRRCTSLVPIERRLTLRTHELGQSHARLADFLSIPVGSLAAQQGHLNRGTFSGSGELLPETSYLDDVVGEICGQSLREHFPEVHTRDDVDRLWNDASSSGLG